VWNVPTAAIIFTSGGTEALTLAVRGAAASSRIVGATEHAAVRLAAPDAAVAPVDGEGRIDTDALQRLLVAAGPGALVAIQHANNETGAVQDIARIAALVHDHGGRLLVDAVQSAATMALPETADFIAVSAHKLGGAMGVGALIARARADFAAIQPGGGQEAGWRGGTENLVGILGFAAAVAARPRNAADHALALRTRLERAATAAGARINAADAPRLPTISSLHLPGVSAASQLMALDLAGVAVSQGAACSSGTLLASPVLLAMGRPDAARESIRVSTGPTTSDADIDRFLAHWLPLTRRKRAA
jgi:cysteine desulfurase